MSTNICLLTLFQIYWDIIDINSFPGRAVGIESTCNAGDPGNSQFLGPEDPLEKG